MCSACMFMVNTSPTFWMRWVLSSDCTMPEPSNFAWFAGRVRKSNTSLADASMVRVTVCWVSPWAVLFISVMGST